MREIAPPPNFKDNRIWTPGNAGHAARGAPGDARSAVDHLEHHRFALGAALAVRETAVNARTHSIYYRAEWPRCGDARLDARAQRRAAPRGLPVCGEWKIGI